MAAREPQTEMVFSTHGGKRAGAGRPPKAERRTVAHEPRPEHVARFPVHVTLRAVADVGRLRTKDLYLAIREATHCVAGREDFRIVHMSIQDTHIHLIVEADDKHALSSGVWGFEVSAAKHINRAIGQRSGGRPRKGSVMADRYHARPMTTPRAVRNTIAYVLGNWRHHGEDREVHTLEWKVDPFSSGVQFAGWLELADSPLLYSPPAGYQQLWVWRPKTWLLETGWHRYYPLISVREAPGR